MEQPKEHPTSRSRHHGLHTHNTSCMPIHTPSESDEGDLCRCERHKQQRRIWGKKPTDDHARSAHHHNHVHKHVCSHTTTMRKVAAIDNRKEINYNSRRVDTRTQKGSCPATSSSPGVIERRLRDVHLSH